MEEKTVAGGNQCCPQNPLDEYEVEKDSLFF